jgi:drug/metabolite transporter (DMT)-like permease
MPAGRFLPLIQLSWIVFLHAVLLSVESIVIELLSTKLELSPLAIAGNSIMIAGAALLGISVTSDKKETVSVFRAWRYLVPASALIAVGVFFWYDSVSNVGASKEGLLSGPLEVIVILIFARSVLKEKLGRTRAIGAIVALTGFFAAIMSSGSLELLLTWGDIEAIISAVAFGTGVIMVTKLTKSHSALGISGASLLISGAILGGVLWSTAPQITPLGWAALIGFAALPLTAAFTYVVGLARIGASMTSVIASFSILLTILFQLFLQAFGIGVIIPSNVFMAVIGGALGIIGIYLIHRKGN